MGYSKRQFVEGAYSEIGLGSYVFDLSPEQMNQATRRLDAMMAEWNGRGIVISYPLPGDPENTSIDSESNVPDWANEAIILGLAIKIAPSEGKTLNPETKVSFANAFNTVASRCVTKPDMQLPRDTPIGSGNRWGPYQSPFVIPPTTQDIEAPDVDLTFVK